MNYWMRFINVLCIIINSIGLFLNSMLHNYGMALLCAIFVVLGATNLLDQGKSNDEN